ncbi:hypothetical protein G9A89_006894 [Geosiphon pyriformis]|nr:hypothetical protein G9A89_006894 [Geosiphon pyriformis]
MEAVSTKESQEEISESATVIGLKCKKCRRIFISPESFVSHSPGKGQVAFSCKKRDFSGHGSQNCSAYFIEPMEWISGAHQGELNGKILCPNCQAKLGNYSWAGMQCSCGAWITPSFSIHRDRVDEVISGSIIEY